MNCDDVLVLEGSGLHSPTWEIRCQGGGAAQQQEKNDLPRVFRRLLVSIGILLFAAFVLSHLRINLGGGPLLYWSFTRSVDVDQDTYFRFKVALTYRGEPQNFDIVVGCNVKRTGYKDGSSTYEAGLVPTVFGRRMNDGRGLVIRVPDGCRGGTTADGKIPRDLLPLVVVYDDADTLAFGTAYLSDDAYDSPLSVLTFHGAVVEQASRAEFDAFRREQPNLVSREAYHSAFGGTILKDLGLRRARVPFGRHCWAYARFRLFDEQRERARAHWPADRPRYWAPMAKGVVNEIVRPRQRVPLQTDMENKGAMPPRDDFSWDRLTYGLDGEVADRGLPRRHGGGSIITTTKVMPPSYYPDIGEWVGLPWPADPVARALDILQHGPRIRANIDFRNGATRGFGYCYPWLFAVVARNSAVDTYRTFDGVVSVGDQSVTPPPWNASISRPILLENDEFFFDPVQIFLESTRGDV